MKALLIAALLGLGACVTTSSGAPLSAREKALVALQKGDAAGAVKLLDVLHAEAPNDLDVARAWAEAHVKNGSAAGVLSRLGAEDTAVAHYVRGLILFANAKEAGAAAVEAFRRAVEKAPTEGELHYRLGLALLESEQFEAARESLGRALERSPQRTSWHLPYAKALHRVGRSRDATASVRLVVTSDCTPQEAATARALMDEIADPFAGFPKAARGKLDQALGWLQVADVPQQAITELEDIVREYPDLGVVHALLGLAAARVDDAGRAIEELKRAIELSPDDGKAYLYLADLYTARQRSAQARELYEKALEKNPTIDDAWFKLGDVALERQELEKARTAFRTAVRLRPDNWFARGKLALVYQLESNWPAADRELKSELEQRPENLEAVLRLGLLHTEKYLKAKVATDRQAARVEASKWLAQVLEQQPENALASRALERVNQP
ncbi:MAG: tetratricopeptide repeat protein [Myxococcus sp.]|nr:tetratricopeptide repeat protein [Myxococcus sp.]